MVIQLSGGNHLEASWRWRWFRRVRVWSLWRVNPEFVGADGNGREYQVRSIMGFEKVLHRLDTDEMHRHLISMAFPASDMGLFVAAVNQPHLTPFANVPPVNKLRHIQDQAKQFAARGH